MHHNLVTCVEIVAVFDATAKILIQNLHCPMDTIAKYTVMHHVIVIVPQLRCHTS